MLKAPKEVIAMATYDAAVLVAGGDIGLAVESLVSAIVHGSLQMISPKTALSSVIAHLETIVAEMPAELREVDPETAS